MMIPENDSDRERRLDDLHVDITKLSRDITKLSRDIANLARGPFDSNYYTWTVPVSDDIVTVYNNEEETDDTVEDDLTLNHPDLQLIRACIINDIGGIRSALANGASLDEPITSISDISDDGLEDIVDGDFVLDVLPSTRYDYPLDYAVRYSSHDALFYLLSRGADVNTASNSTEYGYALLLAIGRMDLTSIEILLANNCIPCFLLNAMHEENRDRLIGVILWLESKLDSERYEIFKGLLLKADEILKEVDGYEYENGSGVVSDIFSNLGISKGNEQ